MFTRPVFGGPWMLALVMLVLISGLNSPIASSSVQPAKPNPTLLQDRIAIARVYYNRQVGTKQPFERAVPIQVIQQNLNQDELKESVLKKVYGIKVTTTMVEAEIKRIQTTTLAPDTLSELWAATGKNADRFGRAIARPLVVDRLLRGKFAEDTKIQDPIRQRVAILRKTLLSHLPDQRIKQVKSQDQFRELTLKLNQKPDAPSPSLAPVAGKPDEIDFSQLSAELQKVLKVQLTKPGDVSAVIEDEMGFLVYVLRSNSDAAMEVSILTTPKTSFDEWLSQHSTPTKR